MCVFMLFYHPFESIPTTQKALDHSPDPNKAIAEDEGMKTMNE